MTMIPKKTAMGNADLLLMMSVIIQTNAISAMLNIIAGMAMFGAKPQTAIKKRPSPGPKIIKPIEAKNRR